MATRQVDLTDAAWVLISSAARGTMQNQSGQIVKFRADAALPAPSVTVGHVLERGASEAWAFVRCKTSMADWQQVAVP